MPCNGQCHSNDCTEQDCPPDIQERILRDGQTFLDITKQKRKIEIASMLDHLAQVIKEDLDPADVSRMHHKLMTLTSEVTGLTDQEISDTFQDLHQ